VGGELASLGRVFTEHVAGLQPIRDGRRNGREFASHLAGEEGEMQDKSKKKPSPESGDSAPADPSFTSPDGKDLGKVIDYQA